MSKQKIAIFDIDGTLLRWQFFHAIVNQLGKDKYLTDAEHKTIKQARMNWKNRVDSDSYHNYEEVLLNTYLGALPRISPQQHRQAEDEVYDEYHGQLFTYTRDLIKKLKKGGYFIAVISGSHHYIVGKLCKDLGVDDYIGAKGEVIDGKYTGRFESPVFDKAKAFKEIVSKHSLSVEGSFGIGDSASDSAFLELVDNPIAFNPDKVLYKTAKTNKWPIVLERKNVVYELKPGDNYTLKDES